MHRLMMALVLPLICLAQTKPTEGSRARLQQLTPEATARIRTIDGRFLRGEIDSVNDKALVVTTSTGQETLDHSNISQISFKRRPHRGRNALLGLAIGTGAGLAAGAIYDAGYPHCQGSWCKDAPYVGKAAFTPFFGLVGLGVGALIPTGGWREVYRAK